MPLGIIYTIIFVNISSPYLFNDCICNLVDRKIVHPNWLMKHKANIAFNTLV